MKTIVAERGENQPIRVWVAGASTGEEAYSLAILFAEAFDRARRWPNFKLFATDVEQQNVEVGGPGSSRRRSRRSFPRNGSSASSTNAATTSS